MTSAALSHMTELLERVPRLLPGIDEYQWAAKPHPDKWSKKEILGHLIDSAANNHQRFVRGQFEADPDITYDQNLWVRHNYYQYIDSRQLIDFWTLYNRQLLEIWKRLSVAHLQRQVRIGGSLRTLAFLIQDYLNHTEHHLKQITEGDE